ncbi:hypothetical protein ACGC1H_004649 [Rhizoctonia solani]
MRAKLPVHWLKLSLTAGANGEKEKLKRLDLVAKGMHVICSPSLQTCPHLLPVRVIYQTTLVHYLKYLKHGSVSNVLSSWHRSLDLITHLIRTGNDHIVPTWVPHRGCGLIEQHTRDLGRRVQQMVLSLRAKIRRRLEHRYQACQSCSCEKYDGQLV